MKNISKFAKNLDKMRLKSAYINEKTFSLVIASEGEFLKAYRCPAGVLTIGYGHTAGVVQGMTITHDHAERLLVADLEECAKKCLKLLPDVKGNQLGALSSLIFNIGVGAFSKSTLLKVLQRTPTNEALIRLAWMMWVKAGGKVLRGLQKRRMRELELFFTPNND